MEFSNHGKGITSVVVHHQPGGASSFSLGGGYGEDKTEKKMTGKIGGPVAAAAIPQAKPAEEEEKKDEECKDEKPATTSAVAAGTKPIGSGAVGATQQQTQPVRQPPGGKSSGLW